MVLPTLFAGLALSLTPVPVPAPLASIGDPARLTPLADAAPIRLGFALRLRDQPGLTQLLASLQNPASPLYHRWLTPEEFGDRFGLAAAEYDRLADWLARGGFAVTRYPNRLFLEAAGSVSLVRALLSVQLRAIQQEGQTYQTYSGTAVVPDDLAPDLVVISGLDTRLRIRRHFVPAGTMDAPEVGADDFRLFYDMTPLMTQGTAAAGLATVALGTSATPPSAPAIDYYFQSVSFATAPFIPEPLTGTLSDGGPTAANGEEQLDVEMQSVGAQNAAAIELVLAPSSEAFTNGFNFAASMLSTATVVSMSFGSPESEVVGNAANMAEAAAAEQYVQQGLAEGQTWFASSDDTGTVDFPADMPEIVAVGGTQFAANPLWDANGNLTGWQPEAVWDQGTGKSGGGPSKLYPKPSWQTGVGPGASDGDRDIPDIALMAGVNTWQTSGTGNFLTAVGGTSVASPLAAGVFALLAGQLGCRLGDIHQTLYGLGQAQQAGGAAPFHDITVGTNGTYAAAPGYDLATGWGSLDVALLASAWPSCGGTTGTGTSGGGGNTGGATTGATSGAAGGTGTGTTGGSGTTMGGTTTGSVTGTGTGTTKSGASTGGSGGSAGTSSPGQTTSASFSSERTSTGTASTAGDTTGAGAAGSSSGGSGTDSRLAQGVGCGCSSGAGGGEALLLVLLAAFARPRQRANRR